MKKKVWTHETNEDKIYPMRSKAANPPPRSMDRWYWIPLLNESELQYIFAMVEMGVH